MNLLTWYEIKSSPFPLRHQIVSTFPSSRFPRPTTCLPSAVFRLQPPLSGLPIRSPVTGLASHSSLLPPLSRLRPQIPSLLLKLPPSPPPSSVVGLPPDPAFRHRPTSLKSFFGPLTATPPPIRNMYGLRLRPPDSGLPQLWSWLRFIVFGLLTSTSSGGI